MLTRPASETPALGARPTPEAEALTRPARFLALAFILSIPPPAFAHNLNFFGAVRVTTADGIILPAESVGGSDFKNVRIEGPGGIFWSSQSIGISLEAAGREGAELHLDGPGTNPAALTLVSGTLDIATDSPVQVRLADAAVVVRGHAVLTLVPGMESDVRVYSGEAMVRRGNRRIPLSSLKALRIRKSGESSPESLLPAPRMSAPPNIVSAPLELTVQPADESISAGAILVECTTRKYFWEGARRFLFGPQDPVVIMDLPEGIVYLRARTISRSQLAGPPGRHFSTRVLKGPPRVTFSDSLQREILRGQLDPPIPNAVVRWDIFRSVTNEDGAFEFHPDLPLGITVSDLRMETGDGVGAGDRVLGAAILFSDPDQMAYLLVAQNADRQAAIFIRTPQIAIRNSSGLIRITLDKVPLDSADTQIAAPPHIGRVLGFEQNGIDPPIGELAIYQDAESPRIMNVSLESRGEAERFSVHADVLDLGVGLHLPAKAVFENDAGGKLDIDLYRISGLRLEGSAHVSALQSSPAIRSNVWWVRIEAEDLLGNAAFYEKTVFHKRHKKFVSVGLKDLIRIWKNKL